MVSSQPHWSRIGESGTLIGMKLFLLMFRFFGRRGFMFFLFPVMSYYYLFHKEARQASKEYLQQIRSFLSVEQQVSLSSFRHFLMFGEIVMDKLLVWMELIHREDVVFETPDVIEKLHGSNKGGIIIVSHLGNFEVGSALASQIPNMHLTILVYTRHAKKFNTLMKRATDNADIEIMQVTDVSPATIMLLSDRIKAGGYVVIAGDRIPVTGQQRISTVNFLGRLAPLPQGAFIIAGLLKCPVYLMFCLKQHTKYHVYFESFTDCLELSRRKKGLQILDNAVQEFANRLEHYCLIAPMQWFNFFPFWSGNQGAKGNYTASTESDTGIS